MIHFGYTILYVKDVTRSIEFYEKAFDLTRKFIAGDAYGELNTGATTLSFASIPQAQSNFADAFEVSSPGNKPFGFEIGFTTTDVEGTLQKALKAGATLVAKTTEKSHGQTVAYVRDLDGFLVEICTPME